MTVTAQALCLCLLGYIIHTATGHLNHVKVPIAKLLDESGTNGDFFYEELSCDTDLKPWQAALFFNNVLVCSGALVHPQWVLTSAQCWRPFYTIGLGLQRLHRTHDAGVQMMEANYSVPHPRYRVAWQGNDVMLIKLSQPVVLTDTIRVINVASTCPTAGTRCLASSWGHTLNDQYCTDRQCVDLVVQYPLHCKAAYKVYNDNFLCASAHDNNDLCKVGSGGPVVCRGYLQGLVSRRFKPCRNPGIPALFTNLCMFQEWIMQVIRAT